MFLLGIDSYLGAHSHIFVDIPNYNSKLDFQDIAVSRLRED